MGKLRYVWVTLLPLTWDLAVTLTASYLKIFSADPRIGFFAQRGAAQEALANGELYGAAQTAEQVRQVVVNSTVDGVLSILFALAIIVVIADAARVWIGLIRGSKRPEMSEAAYEPSRLDANGNPMKDRELVGAGSGSPKDG
jgi:carbon starvation protein